ncbi:hypothetical protein K523DRAFT_334791, partial [Schizophyllum commune Tattone D]
INGYIQCNCKRHLWLQPCQMANVSNYRWKKNDIVDSTEPTDSELEELMNTDGLDESEVKKRRAVLKKLAAATRKSKKGLVDLNRIARAQLNKKKSGGLQAWHVYSRLYYTERVKATFDARYPEEVKSWEKRKNAAEAKGKKFTEKRPTVIATRNKITREFYKNEDAETKSSVEKMYQEELKGKKADGVLDFDEPQTPQQFQDALSSLGLFAQPFVDATALKTGGVVALLVCAPMPDDGGELGVLSVHAGRTRGLVNEKWPKAFPITWRVAQKGMIEFAREVFEKKNASSPGLPRAWLAGLPRPFGL